MDFSETKFELDKEYVDRAFAIRKEGWLKEPIGQEAPSPLVLDELLLVIRFNGLPPISGTYARRTRIRAPGIIFIGR